MDFYKKVYFISKLYFFNLAAKYVIVIKYSNAAFSGQIYLYNDC